MSEENNSPKKKTSIEWLMRGVLTKLGDTFDSLTGRKWNPSSSLATSELIEKLKKLLDLEVKDLGARGKFVPHNIKLKMQWDKFSTDAEEAITRLENELTVAAIDHINDNRYHTYAPIKLEITPDYFTEGVKLLVTFDKFDEENREAQVNVTVPQIKVGDYLPQLAPEAPPEQLEGETYIARYTLNGKEKQVELTFDIKQRRAVGRTKDNDLPIEDQSVSKIHATLVLNSERTLLVADTGSTNGTFINDKRIAYGRAFPFSAGDKVKFGNIDVAFEHVPRAIEETHRIEYGATEEIAMHEIPQESFSSASQRDIQTVAFNSNDDVSVKTEFAAAPQHLPAAPPKANVQPKENLPETRFMDVKPVAPTELPVAKTEIAKPESKEKTETSSAQTTSDRINYDFSSED